MLAPSPWFSAVGSWPPLDDNPRIQYQDDDSWRSSAALVGSTSDNYYCYSNQQLVGNIIIGSSERYISVGEEDQSPRGGSFTVADDSTISAAKKRNHNATERDRRKKINGLYSSLRSLLPAPDQSKKLSIPATVLRVVKYIPELQREVETLIEKKEKLCQAAGNLCQQKRQRKPANDDHDQASLLPAAAVSASKLGDREFIVQISTSKAPGTHLELSDVLRLLEENGLLVVDVSSLRSIVGRDLFTIHLFVEGAKTISGEWLREKLVYHCVGCAADAN
ncbi:hypothetical protein Dimus_029758 [Dionaea muscipula]